MPSMAQKKEKAKRIIELEKAMALGMSPREMQIHFSVTYKVSERQVRKDIHDIRLKWAEEAEAENKGDLRRNQTRQLLNAIVRKALGDKAYGAAVAATNRLMELDGLKILRVEHSGNVGIDIEKMTSDDKRKEMEEIMEKARERRRQVEASKAVH